MESIFKRTTVAASPERRHHVDPPKEGDDLGGVLDFGPVYKSQHHRRDDSGNGSGSCGEITLPHPPPSYWDMAEAAEKPDSQRAAKRAPGRKATGLAAADGQAGVAAEDRSGRSGNLPAPHGTSNEDSKHDGAWGANGATVRDGGERKEMDGSNGETLTFRVTTLEVSLRCQG